MRNLLFCTVLVLVLSACAAPTKTSLAPTPSEGSIIPGVWVSERGAEYIFNRSEMICKYVPPELNAHFRAWQDQVRLKAIRKTDIGYSAKQALRNRSMEAYRWIDAIIVFKSEDEFEIIYLNERTPDKNRFVRKRQRSSAVTVIVEAQPQMSPLLPDNVSDRALTENNADRAAYAIQH